MCALVRWLTFPASHVESKPARSAAGSQLVLMGRSEDEELGNQRGITCFMLAVQLLGSTSNVSTWWRHQMETFSALLAICVGNSPVPGEFPTQGPVTRSFDVYFDLRPNKLLSKQLWGWWFETQSRPLWRHRNEVTSSADFRDLSLHWQAACYPLRDWLQLKLHWTDDSLQTHEHVFWFESHTIKVTLKWQIIRC